MSNVNPGDLVTVSGVINGLMLAIVCSWHWQIGPKDRFTTYYLEGGALICTVLATRVRRTAFANSISGLMKHRKYYVAMCHGNTSANKETRGVLDRRFANKVIMFSSVSDVRLYPGE